MARRLLKEIVIGDGYRLTGNKYKSYKAIAKDLKPGESMWVAVFTYRSGDSFRKLIGYGEVEKTSETSYNYPGRLTLDI